jgi:hypothetical protein
MKNWRKWLYDTLRGMGSLTAIVPQAQIKMAGTMNSVPKTRPFIVAVLEESTPEIVEASAQDVRIWVHDNPGSYERIDDALEVLRSLEGPVMGSDGGIYARWQGDSRYLDDPENFYTPDSRMSVLLVSLTGQVPR